MEEAHIGSRGEKFLIYMINTNQAFAEQLKDCIKKLTGITLNGKITAKRGQSLNLWKTDIVLVDQNGQQVGISLKTIKKSSRPDDHLDRRWLDKPGRYSKPWSVVLNMPNNVKDILQQGIIRKAQDKNQPLVDPQHQPIIRNFLMNVIDKFVEEAFRNSEHQLLIFAILEYNDKLRLHLFNIEDIINYVINDIKQNGITFGRRINLGNYLQLQRKAGNGKHIKLPKTDPRHPGNQLQVKVLTRNLRNDAIVHGIKYCVFEFSEFKIKDSKQRTLNNFI